MTAREDGCADGCVRVELGCSIGSLLDYSQSQKLGNKLLVWVSGMIRVANLS